MRTGHAGRAQGARAGNPPIRLHEEGIRGLRRYGAAPEIKNATWWRRDALAYVD